MSPPEVEPLVCRKYEIKRRLGKGVSAWGGGRLWEMGWPVVDRVVLGAGVVVGARRARESWRGPCGVQGTVRAPGGPRELRGCLGVQEPLGALSVAQGLVKAPALSRGIPGDSQVRAQK